MGDDYTHDQIMMMMRVMNRTATTAEESAVLALQLGDALKRDLWPDGVTSTGEPVPGWTPPPPPVQPVVSESMQKRHQLLELYDPARGQASMDMGHPAIQQMFDPSQPSMEWNPQAFTPMGPESVQGPLSPPVPGMVPQGGPMQPSASQAAQTILGDIAEFRSSPVPMATPMVQPVPTVQGHPTIPQQWQGYDPSTFVSGVHQTGMLPSTAGFAPMPQVDEQPRPQHGTGFIQAEEPVPEWQGPTPQFEEEVPGVHEPGMIKQDQEMSGVYKYPERHQPTGDLTPDEAQMLEQTFEAPKESPEEELSRKLEWARGELENDPLLRNIEYDAPLKDRKDYLRFLFTKHTVDLIRERDIGTEERSAWKAGEIDDQYLIPIEAFSSDAYREGFLAPYVADLLIDDVREIQEWLPDGDRKVLNQEIFETAREAANQLRNSPIWYGVIDEDQAAELRAQGVSEEEIRIYEEGLGHGLQRSNAWGWLGANLVDLTLIRMGLGQLGAAAIAGGATKVKGGTAIAKALEAFGRGWVLRGRKGALVMGALEGLPTDVAIALKNKNEGPLTVGMGVTIGALTGAFAPGFLGNRAPGEVRDAVRFLDALNDEARKAGYSDHMHSVLEGLATLAEDAPGLHQAAKIAFAEAGADDATLKQIDEAMDPIEATSNAVDAVLPILRQVADGEYAPAVKSTARKAVEEIEDTNAVIEATKAVSKRTDPEAIEDVLETIRRGEDPELDFESPRIQEIVQEARTRAHDAGSDVVELSLKEEEEVIDEVKEQAAREVVELLERIQRKRLPAGTNIPSEGPRKVRVTKETTPTDTHGTINDLRELGITVNDFEDEAASEMFARIYQNPAARQLIRDARNLYRRGAVDATEAAETMRLIVRHFGQVTEEGVMPSETASQMVSTLMNLKKNVSFQGNGSLIDMLHYRWHEPELPAQGPGEGAFWAETLKLKGAEAQKFIENIWPKLNLARHRALGSLTDNMDTRSDAYAAAPFRNQRNTMQFIVQKLREAKHAGVLDGPFVDNLVRQFQNIEMWNSATRYSILKESMGYAARMAPTWKRKAGQVFGQWKKLSRQAKLDRAREWYLRSVAHEATVTPKQLEAAASGAEPVTEATRRLRRPKGLPKKTPAERAMAGEEPTMPSKVSIGTRISDVDLEVDVPEDKVLLDRYEEYLSSRWDFYLNFNPKDATHVANLVRVLNEFEQNRWISNEEMWMSIDNPHYWFPELEGAARQEAIREVQNRGLTKMMYGPGTDTQKMGGIMDIMSHQSGLESNQLANEAKQITYDRTHMRYDPNAEPRWHGTDPLPDRKAQELTLGGPDRVSPEGRFRAFAQREIQRHIRVMFDRLRGKSKTDPRYNERRWDSKQGRYVQQNRQQINPKHWRNILRGKSFAKRFPGFGHDGSEISKTEMFSRMVDQAGSTGIRAVDNIPNDWNDVFTLGELQALLGEWKVKNPQWLYEVTKQVKEQKGLTDAQAEKWIRDLFTGFEKLDIYAGTVNGEANAQTRKLMRSRLGPRGLIRRLSAMGPIDPAKARKAKDWERPYTYPGLTEEEATRLVNETYRLEELGIIDKLQSLGYDDVGALDGLLRQFRETREWTNPSARLRALEKWTKEFIDTSPHVGGLPRGVAEFASEYVEEDAFTDPLPILIGGAGQEFRVTRKAIGGDQHIYTATDPLSGKDVRARTLDGLQKQIDQLTTSAPTTPKEAAALQVERHLRETVKGVKRTEQNRAAFEVLDEKIDRIMTALKAAEARPLTKEEMAMAAKDLAEFLRASDNIELLPIGPEPLGKLRAEGYTRITGTLDLDMEQLKMMGFSNDEAFALIERGEYLKNLAIGMRGREGMEKMISEYADYLKAFDEWMSLDVTGQVAKEFAEFGYEGGPLMEQFVRKEGTFTDFYARYKKAAGSNVDLKIEYMPAMVPGGVGAWMWADQDYSSEGWENGGVEWGAAGHMSAGLAMAVLAGRPGVKQFLSKIWGSFNLTQARNAGSVGYELGKYSFWADINNPLKYEKPTPRWKKALTFSPGDKASRIIDHVLAGKKLDEDLSWGDKAIVWTERMFTKLTNSSNLVARTIAGLSGQPIQKVQKDFQVARAFYVKAQHHLAEVMPRLLSMQGDDPKVRRRVQGVLDAHMLYELGLTGRVAMDKNAQRALKNMIGDLHQDMPRETAIAYEINRQYQAIVKLEYEAGLLTKQEFDDITNKGQFYSPLASRPGLEELDFYGLQDIDVASTPSAGLRSWVGDNLKLTDSQDVDDFLNGFAGRVAWDEMLVADVIAAHARIGRHSLNMGILDLAEMARTSLKAGELDDPLLSMIVDVTMIPRRVMENANAADKKIYQEINDQILKVKNSPQFDKKHVITIKDVGLSPRHKEITNVERGTRREVWVRSQDFIDYFANLEYEARNVDGPVTRAMTKFKNMKRWGVTVAPAFMLRNFLRDTMTAAIQRETIFSPVKRLATGNMETGQRDAIRVGLAAASAAAATGAAEIAAGDDDSAWKEIPLWVAAAAAGLPAAAIGDYMAFAAKDVGTGLLHMMPIDTPMGQALRRLAVKLRFTQAAEDVPMGRGRAGIKLLRAVEEEAPLDVDKLDLDEIRQLNAVEAKIRIRNQSIHRAQESIRRRQVAGMDAENTQRRINQWRGEVEELLDERDALRNTASMSEGELLITLYDELQNSGALSLGFYPLRGEDRTKLLKQLGDRKNFVTAAFTNVRDFWEGVGRAIETTNRYRLYREVSASPRGAFGYTDATFAAADGTLDFTKKGMSKEIRWMGKTTAFFNPAMLGVEKGWNIFMKDVAGPGGAYAGGKKFNKDAMINTAMAVTAPSVALWYLNSEHAEYNSLPDWERQTFWHIPLDGYGNKWLRVPKPFEVGYLFGTLPEMLLSEAANVENLRQQTDNPYTKAALGMMKDIAFAVWKSGYSYGSFPMPDLPTWAAELASGRNFFTGMKFDSGFSQGPKYLEGSSYDSTIGLMMSEAAYKLSDGAINWSPARMDHALWGPAATAGRLAAEATSGVARATGVDPRAAPVRRIDPLHGLIVSPSSRWHHEQEVQEAFYRGRAVNQEMTQAMAAGDVKRYEKLIQDHMKDLIVYEGMNAFMRDLDGFSKLRKHALDGTGMFMGQTPEQRQEAVFVLNKRMSGVWEAGDEAIRLLKSRFE